MSHPLQSPPNSHGLALADLQLLARLVHASPAVLYSCNVAGDCGTIAVTENVRAVLGYAPEEFIDDPSFWAVRVHPGDAPRVFEGMPALLREGAQVVTYRFRHALGHYVMVRDQMTVEFDGAGQPLRILGCWLETFPHQETPFFAARFASALTETTTNTGLGGNYAEPT